MSNNNRPSCLMLILHIVLTIITGGAWLIVYLLWSLMKNNKK